MNTDGHSDPLHCLPMASRRREERNCSRVPPAPSTSPQSGLAPPWLLLAFPFYLQTLAQGYLHMFEAQGCLPNICTNLQNSHHGRFTCWPQLS
jgi:hypothetical protein